MAIAVERMTVRLHIDRHRLLQWQWLEAAHHFDDELVASHIDLQRNDFRERRNEHLRMRESDGLQIIVKSVVASTTCAIRRAQERLLQQESRHRRAGWPALWVADFTLLDRRVVCLAHVQARAFSDLARLPRQRARATMPDDRTNQTRCRG